MRLLKIVLLALCSLLAYIFVGGAVWVPFFLFGLFFVWVEFSKKTSVSQTIRTDSHVVRGIVGEYEVDGEKLYGLYLDLCGDVVFVDLRRDSLIAERERLAMHLFELQSLLCNSLNEFLESNPGFKKDKVYSLGIHSEYLERVEVFWLSGNYTLLRSMVFVME